MPKAYLIICFLSLSTFVNGQDAIFQLNNSIALDILYPGATGDLIVDYKSGKYKNICTTSYNNGVPNQSCSLDLLENKNYRYTVLKDIGEEEWVYLEFPIPLVFPHIKNEGQKWLEKEKRNMFSVKETYKSFDQKITATFTHNEMIKSTTIYKEFNSEKKKEGEKMEMDVKFDREENIKGMYSSFYPSGAKRSRHKYDGVRMTDFKGSTDLNTAECGTDLELQGEYTSYYENGRKLKIVTYKNSYSITYKGNPRELEPGELMTQTGEATVQNFYDNGKLQSTGSLVSGKPSGIWMYYFDGVTIQMEVEFEDGLNHGKFVTYHQSGKEAIKGVFEQGKKHGKWMRYFESGDPEEISKFEQGVPEGKYVAYFDNGSIKETGEYIGGQKNGLWEEFYDNGTKKARVFFKNGQVTNSEKWDESGAPAE